MFNVPGTGVHELADQPEGGNHRIILKKGGDKIRYVHHTYLCCSRTNVEPQRCFRLFDGEVRHDCDFARLLAKGMLKLEAHEPSSGDSLRHNRRMFIGLPEHLELLAEKR